MSKDLVKLTKEEPDNLVRYLVGNSIEEVERSLINATLERCMGKKALTAELLGITPRTLSNKLKKYTESRS
ncbi:helix-turn-helix domain-containing protein [Sulfitobacter sp. R18_1]|uniref:helix-turn-helix domain-containing protein n=1 Tax=Sulfitobacter sp. R18_1 TaxID=2821104 RepID=UPI001ADC1EF4|nr:helix-turn-helix domain-containing protein [Sulfitobacter sp. R18_1]MBO9428624.1 helix-turn-helix domain-containing protein [Sulfitobacter sp. R18_1]